MTSLRIGRQNGGGAFTLPPAIGTQTSAIVGIRGSGKTVTGTVLVEELLKLGHQVVIIDPTDVWWGLKSSGDGNAAGFPIVVIGGPHGDLPLEAGMGPAIADFAVETRAPLVLSLRHLRKGRQQALVTEFCEQLYHRKGEAANRTPVLVVIDEASAFVPQRVGAAEAQMVGAIEDLVRRGRSAGIGVALIDQRPASVNKNVLTQLEVLVAHRVTSPQDSKALDEWVRLHDTGGHRETFLGELPSLPQGAAWFWSPGMDVLARVDVRMRDTYDSSRTPKPGEDLAPPAAWAEVDLGALGEQLSAAVKEAEASDPKALRKRIAELEQENSRLRAQAPDPDAIAKAMDAARNELLERVHSDLVRAMEQLTGTWRADLWEKNSEIIPDSSTPAPEPEPVLEKQPAKGRTRKLVDATPSPTPPPPAEDDAASISNPQQRILDALAAFLALGIRDVARSNVAVFADQSPRSSGFANNLGHLRSGGYLDYPSSGMVALTIRGRAYANKVEPIRSRRELHEAWYQKLSNPQAEILRSVTRAYPKDLDRTELAQLATQSPTSSGYANNLGQLRSLGLIDYPRSGRVKATDLLFPEGLR